MKKVYLILGFLSLLFSNVIAQKIMITGKVTSAEDRMALPGVTVRVKDQPALGTITDMDGKYAIEAPDNGVLIFSFIGMLTQEVPINKKTVINILLNQESLDLGEIVIMGYSSSSRKLISSSVGVVNEKEMRNIPMKTIDNVMQGKSAGLNITQNSGTPGGGMTFRIRGIASINGGSEPLFVVDGIPIIQSKSQTIGFGGQGLSAISDLSPSDIESVTILKDASATAIYGARGSNGVVLITTKRGAVNQGGAGAEVKSITNLDFSYNFGLQQMPKERMLHMMDAEEYLRYKNRPGPATINTNWINEVLRVAPMATYELSASGGTGKTNFYIGGSYYNQEGVVIGTQFERWNGRINVDHQVNSRLKIGGNMSVSYSFNKRVRGDNTLSGVLPNAISEPPIYAIYDTAGKYDDSGPYANPIAIAKEAINHAFTFRTLGDVNADFKIMDGLIFSTKWGLDAYNLREHSYDPITTRLGAGFGGRGIESYSNVSKMVNNNVLNYSKTFNDQHNIDAMIGTSFEKYSRKVMRMEGIGFPNERFEYLTSATTILKEDYTYAEGTDRGLVSYFGQVKYNYKFKYILTLTARRDGSSKFGKNNRFGTFPAVSLAWRSSEEEFIKQLGIFSDLKVRLSYGLTGNDGIPDYRTLSLYVGNANYNGQPGIIPSQLPNPDLKWETTMQRNLGFDFGFLQDRVTVNLDMYWNKTKDMLFARPVPASSGFNSITYNIGELENKGFEITLNTTNLDGEVNWTSSLNISHNKNKVLQLINDQPIIYGQWSNNSVIVGEPAGVYLGHRSLGVDPSTGDIVWDDVNHDGQITAEDMVVIGDPNPLFTSGLSNNVSYKGFELSVFLHMVYGNDVFNATDRYIKSGKFEDNQKVDILNAWQHPGDITDIPRVTDTDPNNNNRISSRYVEDGSYMRIKNVTLSYIVPKPIVERIKMRSARISFSVQNLYTFTAYSGMDPEVNYAGDDAVVTGTDFFTFPQVRTYSFGISLGF